MDLSRRKVLSGLIAAPAVARLGLLMPVKKIIPVISQLEWKGHIFQFSYLHSQHIWTLVK